MKILVIKIKNNTDECQDVNVLNDFTIGTECETEIKEMSMLFDGIKIVTNSGGRVDACFSDKSININGVDIDVSEWFGITQLTTDFVNIKMKLDYFDSMSFKLRPRKKVELYIPCDKCNFKLYQKNTTEHE